MQGIDFTRYTNDEEKIRGTRTITPPPSTECWNSRNSSHHPSGYPTNGWTGNSPLSLASFTFFFIQLWVCKAQAAGTRPNISQIPAKLLNDSTFLNTLHGHVNAWIKSIQSVTKLNRDVASGTASQEINFWLTFERALEGIEAQLRSDEVSMVMDCLRNAKRFHATVSFIADTGLKDATDQGKSSLRNPKVAQVSTFI